MFAIWRLVRARLRLGAESVVDACKDLLPLESIEDSMGVKRERRRPITFKNSAGVIDSITEPTTLRQRYLAAERARKNSSAYPVLAQRTAQYEKDWQENQLVDDYALWHAVKVEHGRLTPKTQRQKRDSLRLAADIVRRNVQARPSLPQHFLLREACKSLRELLKRFRAFERLGVFPTKNEITTVTARQRWKHLEATFEAMQVDGYELDGSTLPADKKIHLAVDSIYIRENKKDES